MRTWTPLDIVVVLAGAACALVAIWLLTVVATVLPDRDPGGIPGWALFAAGLLGYVGLTIARLRGAADRRWGTLTIVASGLAVIVGGSILVDALARTTDFEGYLVVIGASVFGLGIAMLAREITGRSRNLSLP
jgi:hypothetical protein